MPDNRSILEKAVGSLQKLLGGLVYLGNKMMQAVSDAQRKAAREAFLRKAKEVGTTIGLIILPVMAGVAADRYKQRSIAKDKEKAAAQRASEELAKEERNRRYREERDAERRREREEKEESRRREREEKENSRRSEREEKEEARRREREENERQKEVQAQRAFKRKKELLTLQAKLKNKKKSELNAKQNGSHPIEDPFPVSRPDKSDGSKEKTSKKAKNAREIINQTEQNLATEKRKAQEIINTQDIPQSVKNQAVEAVADIEKKEQAVAQAKSEIDSVENTVNTPIPASQAVIQEADRRVEAVLNTLAKINIRNRTIASIKKNIGGGTKAFIARLRNYSNGRERIEKRYAENATTGKNGLKIQRLEYAQKVMPDSKDASYRQKTLERLKKERQIAFNKELADLGSNPVSFSRASFLRGRLGRKNASVNKPYVTSGNDTEKQVVEVKRAIKKLSTNLSDEKSKAKKLVESTELPATVKQQAISAVSNITKQEQKLAQEMQEVKALETRIQSNRALSSEDKKRLFELNQELRRRNKEFLAVLEAISKSKLSRGKTQWHGAQSKGVLSGLLKNPQVKSMNGVSSPTTSYPARLSTRRKIARVALSKPFTLEKLPGQDAIESLWAKRNQYILKDPTKEKQLETLMQKINTLLSKRYYNPSVIKTKPQLKAFWSEIDRLDEKIEKIADYKGTINLPSILSADFFNESSLNNTERRNIRKKNELSKKENTVPVSTSMVAESPEIKAAQERMKKQQEREQKRKLEAEFKRLNREYERNHGISYKY